MKRIKKNSCLTFVGRECKNEAAHDVDIYVNNRLLARIAKGYGSCDSHMKESAVKWMKSNGYLPKDIPAIPHQWYRDNNINFLMIEAEPCAYSKLNASTVHMID